MLAEADFCLLSFSARLVPFLQCQGKIIAFCGTDHDTVLQILKVVTLK